MSMSRIVKSIAFNMNDPIEKEMFEFTQQYPQFATLVKRLIHNAMSAKDDGIQVSSPMPLINVKKHHDKPTIGQEFIKQLI